MAIETSTPKKAPARQAPAKQAPAKQASAKQAPAKQAPAKQARAKQASAKQAPAKQAPAKQAPAKQSPAKQSPAKQSPAKQSPAKQSPAKQAATGRDAARVARPVAEGERAPAFALPDHTGGILRSDSLARAPYVLYFYPKDDTPGCTREACGFRDAGSELARLGVRVLGVSADSPASHARFRAKYSLDFPLISDVDRTLMAAYGAFGKKVLYGKATEGVIRSTFLVDAAGVVRKAWRNVKVDGHVDQVLGALRDL